ncbi:MAG: hypothetical protein JW990_15900 [Thermoleophilia bacterium]|nr:hypothetical protein [Thermoleophilia bacterium]
MARLRNRIVKADYWGDGDLLRMPRDMRDTYRGLWAIAEDSGCLEDDPFTWKLLLWPGPFDADITVDLIAQWRDELIDASKLVPYIVDGRRYFFIEPFHRHEHPRNPQKNDLPLPPWVLWVPSEKDPRKGLYNVDWGGLAAYLEAKTGLVQDDTGSAVVPKGACKTVVQALNNDSTSVVQGLSPARPALPCPARYGTVQNHIPVGGAEAAPDGDEFADIDFGEPQSDTEKPSKNGKRPKNDTPERAPVENAGTMVAFLVDYAREIGFTLTGTKKGHFARAIGDIWKAGVDPEILRESIRQALENNKSPAYLVDVVNDLKGGGRGKAQRDSGRSQHGEWE